ncbi:MAG: Do family serine endopeptidase [Hyphomicrobiaceae bacterium]|nr:Do family serine endopeptidase [Hyphomicrobiaceae bacterium]
MSFEFKSKTKRLLGAVSVAAVLAAGGFYAATLTAPAAVAQVSVQVGAPSSFADLVEAVNPAVVSVNVSGQRQVRQFGPNFQFQFPDLPEDHPFRDLFRQFGQQFGQDQGQNNGQPQMREFQAAGSGFVISADGYIVTNNHVVQDADNVSVTFNDGTEKPATVVGTDPRTDLALLKIDDGDNLTYVDFASDPARVGDWVVAIGNPFGLGDTVTAGIVSARGRDITPNSYGDYIQIDAAINRGNSGGPAFNLNGQVVGVNTAIFSPNGGNVGIAFAIPASTVQQVINDLKDDGAVTRGFLGVHLQDIDQVLANSIGLDKAEGAMVTQPTDGGPAAGVGIQSGDVITAVNGKPIKDSLELSRTISRLDPGSNVDVQVFRQGQSMDFQVQLGTLNEQQQASLSQPAEPAPPPVPQQLGLELAPNPDGDGLVIDQVATGSVADDTGFTPGDVIVQANNQAVATVADFERIVGEVKDSGKDAVFLKVLHNDQVVYVGLPVSQ